LEEIAMRTLIQGDANAIHEESLATEEEEPVFGEEIFKDESVDLSIKEADLELMYEKKGSLKIEEPPSEELAR
jgi:hypothetical protein